MAAVAAANPTAAATGLVNAQVTATVSGFPRWLLIGRAPNMVVALETKATADIFYPEHFSCSEPRPLPTLPRYAASATMTRRGHSNAVRTRSAKLRCRRAECHE
jgi:hypothetical protein